MNLRNHLGTRVCLLAASLFAGVPFASAQVNVTTERYDQARTGANLSETQLNTSNVNVNQFGKLWSYTVSGSVQAQPLYVQGVNIPGKGTHNVLYVVTMNDVVYAFDADSSSNTPLWSRNLATQFGGTPVPIADIVPPDLNIVGNVGIESTPYIDLSTNTMYLAARTKESGSPCGSVNGNYCQRLHALDIASGAEKLGGPVVIQGSVSGTGNASVGGTLTFDPKIHNQRSSLALANGQIFMAWASHEDDNPYHGWVMSYNASTLAQTGIWCSSPDGFQAGIWMSGRAPAVDASNNVYYMVGNGDWNGTRNFGESMLKLGSTSGMPLLDWFTPDSWSSLNAGDVDYGSSGPILIPGTDLIVGGGKSSIFYLTHTGGLGHEQTGNGQIVQVLDNQGGEIKGGPIYWNRSGGLGPWMYVWSNDGDRIKAYHFNGTQFDTGIISEGTLPSPGGASGGVLTLSANGSTAGSGIVWSSMPLSENGDHGVHHGVLRAVNADDLTTELWNSNLNAARDDMGNWPKYSPPTVVNGRVYMASFPGDGTSNTAVNVYGLLSVTPDFTISVSPGSVGVSSGGSANYTIDTTAILGYAGTVDLSVSGLPAGSTASWSSTTVSANGGAALTVTTSAGTPLGSFTLTVTGTSGSLTHSATTTLVVSTSTPGAGAISIDFVGGGTAMGATEVAGVVPKANWNDAVGANGSGQALVDENATATGATVTWAASGVWSLPISDVPGDARMMKGYLDGVGQNTVVTVAGLPVSAAGYDVYVYADGDNPGATRTAAYQISGAGITTTSVNMTDVADANFSGTYTQANNSNGNYVQFTIAANGFTLTAIPGAASDGVQRAPVNGIQIIAHVPTPDYSFSVSPASQTVTPGNSTTYTANVTAINGFIGSVALSASGLPTGATASFSPSSITGTGSSTLTVSTASATPTGTYTLTISSSSGSLAHSATVTLVVSPAAAPTAQVAPGSLLFGTQNVGTRSAAQPVMLTNNGTATLNISAISASGDFSQTNTCGSALAAGANCTISVAFNPSQSGSRTGTLSITDNATGSPQTVSLFGTGVTPTPAASLSDPTVTFGGLLLGSTSAAHAVLLTNSGAAPLKISGIYVSGDFSETNNCGSTLAAGATCTINVNFRPTQGGSRAGELWVTDTVGDQQTDLSGTGMDFLVTTAPSSGNVTAGKSSSFNAMVSSVGRFNQAVALTCTGAPATATCGVSPSSVTPSSAGAAAATVTITTTARSTAGWRVLPRIPPGLPLQLMQITGWFLALGIVIASVTQRKQRVRLALCASMLVMVAIAAAGCASVVPPDSDSGSPSPSVTGTQAGTYTITITATSGNRTQTSTYSLTVK